MSALARDGRVAATVLIIGGSDANGSAIKGALVEKGSGQFVLEFTPDLEQALTRMAQGNVAAVLVDLDLPDSRGLATLLEIVSAQPQLPVLVLGPSDSEALAEQALANGAQDYLSSTHLDRYTLVRALRSAIGRKGAEDELFLERERAQVTLNSIGDAVLSTDSAGSVTYLNAAATTLTGWSSSDAVGRPFTDVFKAVDGETREAAENPMSKAIEADAVVGLSANTVLLRRDGTESPIEDSVAPIHDRAGQVIGAVIVFHDVSDSRSMTEKMSHLAQYDFLTDLPNRMLFSDRLTRAIVAARRNRRQLAVLFLDLDRFKNINDSLGHDIGDLLLQEVSLRLTDCVRASDTVSRIGGDEFVVLLAEVGRPGDAALTAEKIRAAVLEPFLIAEHRLHLGASIGISVFPDDGKDADAMLKSADTAMYHAKDKGRNNYQFFKQYMNVKAVERQGVEAGLRRGLERDEFVLHYQPKIDLNSGRITGAEALLRWRHPERGLLLPARFIVFAEESGLIVPLGRWVLREACRQARNWLDAGLGFQQMAVNVSAVEFRHPGFFDSVRSILLETGLDAEHLELELTETVLMRDVESSARLLHSLSAMGVRLAIDDFGTGYSSLSYLKRFPIHTLKIDQSFVRDVTTSSHDATIVSAVIGMGHNLDHRVVAEGVETYEQLEFLQQHHCSEGQGYYFSLPVPQASFAALLATGLPSQALQVV